MPKYSFSDVFILTVYTYIHFTFAIVLVNYNSDLIIISAQNSYRKKYRQKSELLNHLNNIFNYTGLTKIEIRRKEMCLPKVKVNYFAYNQ